MRERNEHRQEEGEKVAEITKTSVKTKDKQDEDRGEICRRITRVRKTHRRREDLKGDGSRGESGGEGRRNAGRL